jgi:hypothetical protein
MTDTDDLERRLDALATELEPPSASRVPTAVRDRGEQRARRRRRLRAGGVLAGVVVAAAGFVLVVPADDQQVDTRAGTPTTTTVSADEGALTEDGSCGGYSDVLPEADAAELRATFDPIPEGYELSGELARLDTAAAPGLCSMPPAAFVLGVPPDVDGRFHARGLVVRGPVADPVEQSYEDAGGEYFPPPQPTPIAGGQGEYRWILSPEEASAEQGTIGEAVWLEDDGSMWMANAGGLEEAELLQLLQAIRIDPPSQEVRIEGDVPADLEVLYERDESWTWTPEERSWMVDLTLPGDVGATQGGVGFTLEVHDRWGTPWTGAIHEARLVQVQGMPGELWVPQAWLQLQWSDGERTFVLSGPEGSEEQLLALAQTVRLDPPAPDTGSTTSTTSAG